MIFVFFQDKHKKRIYIKKNRY